MPTTSEKILQTIKEKHIEPAPRWKFLAKNWVLWLAFLVALIIGALSFSVMLEILVNHDWDVYFYLHKTFLQYLLISLPYLWFIFLGLFSWIAYYNFVHIKGWYHHRVYLVILASVASSMFLGVAMYAFGIGNGVDKALSLDIPYYNKLKFGKNDVWSHPEDGLLAGDIVQIANPNEFVIKDLSGNIWNIKSQNLAKQDLEITVGERVKIIGQEEKGNDTFDAKEVRDWDSRVTGKKVTPSNNTPQDSSSGLCSAQSQCNN